MTVKQSVYHWTVVPMWLRWFYDPRCNRLYEQNGQQWFFWSRAMAMWRYHARQPCNEPVLLDLRPATVHRQGGYQCLTDSARILLELDDAMEEWNEALKMPTEFLFLMELVSETDDGDHVAQAIRDGKASQ
jgi:hypothetical protein